MRSHRFQKTGSLAVCFTSALSLSVGAGCAGKTPAASSPSTASAALPAVRQARWFAAEDGMHLELLDLPDDQALLRIVGVDGELDGKVLEHERWTDGEVVTYEMKWQGRTFRTLGRERSGAWIAHLPEIGRDISVTLREDRSASIDPPAVQRLHQQQAASGVLEPIQRFDRAREQRREEESLARESARTSEACGTTIPLQVRWSSVSDEQLLEKSITSYCGTILSSLRELCGSETGKRLASGHVSQVVCTLDGDNHASLADKTLTWSINFELTDARADTELHALKPAGWSQTVGAQRLDDETMVCADAARAHVTLLGPREAAHRGMAYGDGTSFTWVATNNSLSRGWFFDPRQRNEQNNDDFRGLDLRLFSRLEVDSASETCKLTCGKRETTLELLGAEERAAILARARYVDGPSTREPIALARDRAGVYYLVDRGITGETEKDVRLYRGTRGKLRPLAVKETTIDSEGAIIASDQGKLLIRQYEGAAEWSEKPSEKLVLLPLRDNYGLIYGELGVYPTKRLGVPCDDF